MNKLVVTSEPRRLFVRYKNLSRPERREQSRDDFSKCLSRPCGGKKETIVNTTFIKNASTTFIQKIKTILEENLDDENFGIQALCQAIGLSRAQLHNRIKKDTGMSTSIYIRNVRLENAKILLQNSDWNVSEVAYRVGFKCPRYFSTLFLEKYQMTPLTMKRMWQV